MNKGGQCSAICRSAIPQSSLGAGITEVKIILYNMHIQGGVAMNRHLMKRCLTFLTYYRVCMHPTFCIASIALFLTLASPIVSQCAYAFDVRLEWEANTEPDLAGYKIFFRKAGEEYDYDDAAWIGTATTCTISDLDDDTAYFFVARALDSAGYESGDSNEASTDDEAIIDDLYLHVDNAGDEGGCFIRVLKLR